MALRSIEIQMHCGSFCSSPERFRFYKILLVENLPILVEIWRRSLIWIWRFTTPKVLIFQFENLNKPVVACDGFSTGSKCRRGSRCEIAWYSWEANQGWSRLDIRSGCMKLGAMKPSSWKLDPEAPYRYACSSSESRIARRAAQDQSTLISYLSMGPIEQMTTNRSASDQMPLDQELDQELISK